MPLALGDLLYAADYVAYADSRQLISIADLLLKTLVAGVYNYKGPQFSAAKFDKFRGEFGKFRGSPRKGR